MNENYKKIIETIDKIIKEFYSQIEKYLQNIFNAPSTINRIIKYYAIGFPSDYTSNKRYIMFGGMIIREYELVMPKYDGLRGEWYE